MQNTKPQFVLDFGSIEELSARFLAAKKLDRSIILLGAAGAATLEIASTGAITTDLAGFSGFLALDRSELEFYEVLDFPSGDDDQYFQAEVRLRVEIAEPLDFLAEYDEATFLALALAAAKSLAAGYGSIFRRDRDQLQTDLDRLEEDIRSSRPVFLGVRLLSQRVKIWGAHPSIAALSHSVRSIQERHWIWQDFDEATLARISQGMVAQLAELMARKESEERRKKRAEEAKEKRLKTIPRGERLSATAFAPLAFGGRSQELAYLALHTQPQLPHVRALIGRQDPEAVQAGPTIQLAAQMNQRVLVRLKCIGGRVMEPDIWTNWNLQPVILPFVVLVDEIPPPVLILVFTISIDDAVIGSIVIRRPTEEQRTDARKPPTYERSMTKIESVFISYSRTDIEKVAPTVATYVRLGVKTFFDQSAIAPGEEWRSKLFSAIKQSELFHLFWSQKACESSSVIDEAKHALSAQRESSGTRPKIFISMLEGPPWPPHPRELDDLQFNDFYRAAAAAYSRG